MGCPNKMLSFILIVSHLHILIYSYYLLMDNVFLNWIFNVKVRYLENKFIQLSHKASTIETAHAKNQIIKQYSMLYPAINAEYYKHIYRLLISSFLSASALTGFNIFLHISKHPYTPRIIRNRRLCALPFLIAIYDAYQLRILSQKAATPEDLKRIELYLNKKD